MYWLRLACIRASVTLRTHYQLIEPMNPSELITIVTEDLKTIKVEYLGLLFYLCYIVTKALKQKTPDHITDLHAILAVELFRRGVDRIEIISWPST